MKTILLLVVSLHYLAVACLSTHATPVKTVFLVGCVIAGAWLVSRFNNWEDK
jgi:energy-converting hydrogenase Eha subunit C